VEWCACFTSWCADQCGYLESGIIPKFSLCSDGVDWFKGKGQWQDKNYEPQAGDIIFFDWGNDGSIDHVGIVEKCENGTVYTVEGNSGDACKQQSYPVGSGSIYGYGCPAY
jgi:cell wall-associated NlpC family hydrolase